MDRLQVIQILLATVPGLSGIISLVLTYHSEMPTPLKSLKEQHQTKAIKYLYYTSFVLILVPAFLLLSVGFNADIKLINNGDTIMTIINIVRIIGLVLIVVMPLYYLWKSEYIDTYYMCKNIRRSYIYYKAIGIFIMTVLASVFTGLVIKDSISIDDIWSRNVFILAISLFPFMFSSPFFQRLLQVNNSISINYREIVIHTTHGTIYQCDKPAINFKKKYNRVWIISNDTENWVCCEVYNSSIESIQYKAVPEDYYSHLAECVNKLNQNITTLYSRSTGEVESDEVKRRNILASLYLRFSRKLNSRYVIRDDSIIKKEEDKAKVNNRNNSL